MTYGRKGLPAEVRAAILDDLKRAAEYAAGAREHTLEAIAARQGVHKRTIQKLIKREGLTSPRPLPLRARAVILGVVL